MSEHNQSRWLKPYLWLITFIGLIVPRRLRSDWKHEWEGELEHREALLTNWERLNWRTKLNLLGRSLGAFWDALYGGGVLERRCTERVLRASTARDEGRPNGCAPARLNL